MNKDCGVSIYDLNIEIKTIEARIKEYVDKAIAQRGQVISPLDVPPHIMLLDTRLDKLKRDRLAQYYANMTDVNKKFMQNMFKFHNKV